MAKPRLTVRSEAPVFQMSGTLANAAPGEAPRCKYKLSELVEEINLFLPEERLCATDLRSPQPQRIQTVFLKLLKVIFGDHLEPHKVPENVIGRTVYPEVYASMGPAVLLGLLRGLFASVHPNLAFKDMYLVDLLRPQKQRTHKFLSSLINFCVFHRDRMQFVQEAESELKEKRTAVEKFRSVIEEYNSEMNDLAIACEERKNDIAQIRRQISSDAALTRQMADEAKVAGNQHKDLVRKEQKLAERAVHIENRLKDETVRKETLEDQCVSSPDKLKAEVASLRKIVEDRQAESLANSAQAGQITDDVERMKESVALAKAAVDAVRLGGTVFKDAFRVKDNGDAKKKRLKELQLGIQELSLQIDSYAGKMEKITKTLGEIRMNGEEKMQAVNQEIQDLEEKHLVPLKARLKSRTDEWTKVIARIKETEDDILAKKSNIASILGENLNVWMEKEQKEFELMVEAQLDALREFSDALEERATSFKKLSNGE